MGLQNLHNRNMNLVLSTDAKPRLKWTTELHQRFVEAVNQLGGADKATPKSLMTVMGIPGLTLYHLKSHLQKYRLGKNQQSLISIENKQEDYNEIQRSEVGHLSMGISSDGSNHNPINESLQIVQALQMQMEVQGKIYEQIEVQRHLQLRIEAQGKYLQSVLRKAQETLSGYNSSSMSIELAKVELSRLVSMVNPGCPSSSISELTEVGGSSLNDAERKRNRSTVFSMASSLTSSDSSGRKEDMQHKDENGVTEKSFAASIELPLMDDQVRNSSPTNKRSGSTISDGLTVEQPLTAKRLKNGDQFRKSTFDLNRKYQSDTESGSKLIDLNSKGI